MRQLFIYFLVLCLWAAPVLAQTSDLPAYNVTDVAVDVAADSAAHARDEAVIEAQRAAFTQLLQRLDADASVAAKLKSDDVAALVQNFEVQNERSSSVRYIGTFTVQFRPNAVRKYLANHGVSLFDTRSKPMVVLPVTLSNGHPVLWEETTRWHEAWSKTALDAGLVPLIVPAGNLDDIAALSTEEAVSGKAEALKAIADKYQAGGVAVVTLNGSLDSPATGLSIDLTRYDAAGNGSPVETISLPAAVDKTAVDDALVQGVKLVRAQLEKDWKQDVRQPPKPADQDQPVSVQTELNAMPTIHLPVTVTAATLAEWAQIRRQLNATPGIDRIDVISLQRGATSIEIETHSDTQSLQLALLQQRLQLAQDVTTGIWTLRSF